VVGYDVVIGVDVGKHTHHACALGVEGERLLDQEVEASETAMREVFESACGHGEVLVVVDQLHSIGALAVTLAQSMGLDVAYLPGLSMRRLADLHPGKSKTDARDAFIIADAARTAPQSLRRLTLPHEAQAELSMLLGYDDDLAGQVTAAINRLRGLLVHIHPSLEKALAENISHEAVLHLLSKPAARQA